MFVSTLVTIVSCNAILGTDAAERKPITDAASTETEDDAETDESDTAVPSKCAHSCLGGECKDGRCQPETLATDLRSANHVLRVGHYAYVSESGVAADNADGRVMRVLVSGCKSNCVSTFAEVPGAIALTSDLSTLFVAAWKPNNGAISTVTIVDGAKTPFSSNQNRPTSIALDATAAYWVNKGLGEGGGSIWRSWLDEPTGGTRIVWDLTYPSALVVVGDHILFTESGSGGSSGSVYRCGLTGDEGQVVASRQASPRGIATDSTYVYWANMDDGTVHRAKADGTGSDEEIVTGCNQPVSVAVDDKHLYITESGTNPDMRDGRVRASDLDGKNVVTLASGLNYATSIALDEDAVYFLERGTFDKRYRDGTLKRIAKPAIVSATSSMR